MTFELFPSPPVLLQVGPFALRWYALAYIAALVLGWRIMRRLVRLSPAVATEEQTDDFLTWATLGVVLGGRLGYVLFYQPGYYLTHPLQALAVWEGGMSFHGGALGVIVAMFIYAARNGLNPLGFADRLVVVVPLGLALGRLANFVNGELWGRVAPDWLPWAPSPRATPASSTRPGWRACCCSSPCGRCRGARRCGRGSARYQARSSRATRSRAASASCSASRMRSSASCSRASRWARC